MQKEYLLGFWNVLTKAHNLKLSSLLWVISILFFVLSIIGVVTIDRQNNEIWSNFSIAALVIVVSLYFWHFFIEIPAKLLYETKKSISVEIDRMSPYYQLHEIQTQKPFDFISLEPTEVLLDTKNEPSFCQAILRSWIFEKIIINKIIIKLELPSNGGFNYVEFQSDETKKITTLGLNQGKNNCFNSIILHKISRDLVVSKIDSKKTFTVEGNALIFTDVFGEIPVSTHSEIQFKPHRTLNGGNKVGSK